MKNTKNYISQTQELKLYLDDVRKHKTMSIDDEKLVFGGIIKAIEEGDKITERKLKDDLVKSNLRYVISVSKDYINNNHGYTIMDLIQEGNYGLVKATDRYDYVGMFDQRFLTYAVFVIRQSIVESLQKNGTEIRLPANQIHAKNKVNKRDIKEEKTYDDYLEEKDTIFLARVTNDLFDHIGNSGGGDPVMLCDILEDVNSPRPDEALDNTKIVVSDMLERLSKKLTEKERYIVESYYGINVSEPMTLESIAEEYGQTKERVRQIKETALRKLRDESLPLLEICY